MFSVVLDTCVLYPAYLRDTLLRMAAAELFRPLWSATILEELGGNLPENVDPAPLLAKITTSFPDAAVTGYEALVNSMSNDPKDRHVLAAAVRSSANAIVTFNLDDFPADATKPYDVEVMHPDVFLLNQLDLAPGIALDVLRRQVAGYRTPEMDLFALAGALERCGCPETAEELRRRAESVQT